MTATSQLPTKLHFPECPSQAGTEPQKDAAAAAAAAAVLTSVPEDANEVGPALWHFVPKVFGTDHLLLQI